MVTKTKQGRLMQNGVEDVGGEEEYLYVISQFQQMRFLKGENFDAELPIVRWDQYCPVKSRII